MESLKDKIARVTAEKVEITDYDPDWPAMFRQEALRLRRRAPPGLIGRIEHFGSTAVPGLCAKPIVDMLVETPDLEVAREALPPIFEPKGYDTFWRPTSGDDTPPFYCWMIRRNDKGRRTHHVHIVEPDFPHWRRLLFRDYLIAHPGVADAYGVLKRRLSKQYPGDRIAYTRAKSDFIAAAMEQARQWERSGRLEDGHVEGGPVGQCRAGKTGRDETPGALT